MAATPMASLAVRKSKSGTIGFQLILALGNCDMVNFEEILLPFIRQMF
jgi:hypothetical protein